MLELSVAVNGESTVYQRHFGVSPPVLGLLPNGTTHAPVTGSVRE
jgi:hypothetical protein